MENIKIATKVLLEELNKNRKLHVETFDEAVKGWRTDAAEIYKKNAERVLKDEDLISVPFKPISYEKAYERAIRVCELTSDSVLELGEHEFQQYVMDEWSWKQSFVASTSNYAK